MKATYQTPTENQSPQFLGLGKGQKVRAVISNCDSQGQCDRGTNHVGPYFTLTLLAVEVGSGSRTGKKRIKRQVLRKRLLRLCEGCLLLTEFHASGKIFRLTKEEAHGKS